MERDAAWLAVVSRATGSGVLLLDGSGTLIAAEDGALKLLGSHSSAELTKHWTPFTSRVADWCAAAKRGDEVAGILELPREHETATLHVRVFRLAAAGTRAESYVALLTESAAEAERVVALTSFARRLGHDLRGPLNAMVLNLDLIRLSVENGGTDEESLPKRKRYLASLQREIDRMSETLTAAVEQVKKGAP